MDSVVVFGTNAGSEAVTIDETAGRFEPGRYGDRRGRHQRDRVLPLGRGGDDRVNGSAGADELNGNGGNDNVSGDSGNDAIRGQTGNDRLQGGPG